MSIDDRTNGDRVHTRSEAEKLRRRVFGEQGTEHLPDRREDARNGHFRHLCSPRSHPASCNSVGFCICAVASVVRTHHERSIVGERMECVVPPMPIPTHDIHHAMPKKSPRGIQATSHKSLQNPSHTPRVRVACRRLSTQRNQNTQERRTKVMNEGPNGVFREVSFRE